MESVPEKISFPEIEVNIKKKWDDIDAFHVSLKKSEGKQEYNFYDGPPFATGLPHYGHILAGTIKDTVTRYAHQTGHHVTRRFGWDCHGLPIEFEIDKELGVKTREDVLKIGIPKYNEACRNIVMRYSNEWEKIVSRLGRWIDFKNDYKTMDKTFMETVWWVFKTIYEKGYVYRGFKVMPYSTGCTTPLSNFEANLAYKDVEDPSIIVSFPLVDEPEVFLIAWTTTPWTLPSNLALCVNPDFDYVKVFDKEKKKEFILCEKRLCELYKNEKQYEIKQKYKGKDLKGKKYIPLFNYFEKEKEKGAFTVLVDNYVMDDSGTGVVHCAPAFGEDDYRVCFEANIISKGEDIPCPVDSNGFFTEEVKDFVGRYVKDADKDIIKLLKENKRLIQNSKIKHSYPFCWRSDTPLLYKAVPSWFIAVEKIKDKLLKNNKLTYWVPDYVKEKRFHNWLANACDWAISRNRYWGTPIPIWISDDKKEIKVVGSIKELKELSGIEVNDLHRENIDHITIPSSRGPQYGVLKRIDEVFDCWFESGSMPYAQVHYPFENKELFEKTFPADFIAEGIDQTRGWFYTLLVISTILFDKPPFKNLIVNGLVLASDGKKMSKRLKNYPDPMYIVNQYGADSLRLYLINSPVVRAENLKFQEAGVRDIIKEVFLPWFNAYRFFVEAVLKFNKQKDIMEFKPDIQIALKSENIMDKWILAATYGLIDFVRKEMEAYRLYTVLPRLVKFIEQLTNWYVRLNRKRLKGIEGEHDCRTSLATLFEVLYTICRAMSPFTPFLTEYFYQNLKKILPENEREESVHYLMFPTVLSEALNPRIEEAVNRMQTVIQLGRTARDKRTLPIKFPLKKVTVIHKDEKILKDIETLKSYILEELNVKEVEITSDESIVLLKAKAEFHLGKKLRKDVKIVSKEIEALTPDQIRELQSSGQIQILGYTIDSKDLIITREFTGDQTKNEALVDPDTNILVILNLEVDEKMKQEGLAREIINRVQRLRKKAGIHPTDPIEVFFNINEKDELFHVIHNQKSFIQNGIGVPFSFYHLKPYYIITIKEDNVEIGNSKIGICLGKLQFSLNEENLKEKLNNDKEFIKNLETLIITRDYFSLLNQLLHDNKIKFQLDNKIIELEYKKDIFSSIQEKEQSLLLNK